MKITETLKEEHKNILKVIEFLRNKCDFIKKDENIDNEFFDRVIEFIVNYADRFHHAKEEDILFREFCKSKNIHCNPTEQMLYEHNLGREFVKNMKIALSENNKDKLAENAGSYCELLEQHIFKEENILYPMAETSLDEKTKKRILEKFRDVEKSKAKEKDRCLKLLEKMKNGKEHKKFN